MSDASYVGLASISSLLGLWIAWWLYRFILLRRLRPNDPPYLPYLLPCLGHTGRFFQDSHQLMARGVKHFNDTREPFSIVILGKTYSVITSPLDATEFYSNTVTLSWDGFLNHTLHAFGVSPERLDVLWAQPTEATTLNPHRKCLIHLTQDLYKQHLLPGPTFSGLIDKYKASLRTLTSWKRITERHHLETSSSSHCFSLYDLCATIMIDATQLSLFDPVLFAIDPTMTDNMRTFTDQLWKLMYESKMLDSKEIKTLREKYTRAFLIYQRLPKEMRKEEAWIVTALIDQYKTLAIHEDDSAAMLVMVYWTGDANAYKLAFWILSYILFDKHLHRALVTETSVAVQDNGEIDMDYLAQSCPLLKSVYSEALRLRKRDLAFRKVESDTHIAGKVLRGGNFALVPVCQLHDDRSVFGSDANRFDPSRFEKNNQLTGCTSFKPYGGGKTYCPGRFFAMQEIFAFVAVMLNRYRVQLDFPVQEFPRPDESSLTLGVSRPLPGQDLRVNLTRPVDWGSEEAGGQ
ncbi:cytochrome p450 [Viridothelium virens]|uniref:Cytochrome p450 n=1 Tax=Viridothelium virens TaxID=1048519 RepID=A0A6A6HBK3_VIRVR|nr:cytochrome p450 [Viridothelium virens]